MSHFGKSGPPDIKDTYSLLVLNISFRTTADDLFPLFDKYGKVVDVFIPRDRRTGDSRGFAFVRYKYQDEAQKAVEKLDGRTVDGREIMVQFAKYGPNAERIQRGRVSESSSKKRGKSRSRSPRPRYRVEHRDRDYRRRSRSRSRDRNDRDRYRGSERGSRDRSMSRSISPDHPRNRGRERGSRDRSMSSSVSADHHKNCGRDRDGEDERGPRGRRTGSVSPARRSPYRSLSPRKASLRGESSDERNGKNHSPKPRSATPPRGRSAGSRSISPPRSNADE